VTSVGAPDSRFIQKKGTGYIGSIFHEEDLVKMKGNLGIGKYFMNINLLSAFYVFYKMSLSTKNPVTNKSQS